MYFVHHFKNNVMKRKEAVVFVFNFEQHSSNMEKLK
jgi:hypothetical protein